MADLQAQASESSPGQQQEQDSSPLNSAVLPPPDDPNPPPLHSADAASVPSSSTSPSNQFCASATCHNNNNKSAPSTSPFSSSSPAELKPCPKCHSIRYCSRTCQKADWKAHKKTCAAAAQRLALTDDRPQVQSRRDVPKPGGAGNGQQQQRLRKWQFDT